LIPCLLVQRGPHFPQDLANLLDQQNGAMKKIVFNFFATGNPNFKNFGAFVLPTNPGGKTQQLANQERGGAPKKKKARFSAFPARALCCDLTADWDIDDYGPSPIFVDARKNKRWDCRLCGKHEPITDPTEHILQIHIKMKRFLCTSCELQMDCYRGHECLPDDNIIDLGDSDDDDDDDDDGQKDKARKKPKIVKMMEITEFHDLAKNCFILKRT
jgi:hypothetical protein